MSGLFKKIWVLMLIIVFLVSAVIVSFTAFSDRALLGSGDDVSVSASFSSCLKEVVESSHDHVLGTSFFYPESHPWRDDLPYFYIAGKKTLSDRVVIESSYADYLELEVVDCLSRSLSSPVAVDDVDLDVRFTKSSVVVSGEYSSYTGNLLERVVKVDSDLGPLLIACERSVEFDDGESFCKSCIDDFLNENGLHGEISKLSYGEILFTYSGRSGDSISFIVRP
ncbi:MAG: hypothetical protein ACLFTH_02450 [Candidatus Woesearchaeota archaeon]